jgi:tricorn protease
MTIRSAVLLLIACAVTTQIMALEPPMPRHPAPSPDGSIIAFSWQGDLWTVPASGGDARRITAHPATEDHPVWSRDGRLLAFASDRHGSMDVFVMPADGSAAPTRLTWADRGDTPFDFTADGSAVIFGSGRSESVRWMSGLYQVPVEGGTPARALDALGTHGRVSPDGGAMVFVRGATKWTRHGYRGSASRTPWLRTADGDFYQLSDFDGDEDHPSWLDDHSLAILSSRSDRKNVHRLDLITGEATPLTNHQGTDVRAPRGAADGSLIAYEFEDALWTVEPESGQPSRLTIRVPADVVMDRIHRETSTSGASAFAIHPDGDLAAFIVEGDLWVTEILSKDEQEIAPPRTVQVTRTPEREEDPTWSPDGERILFTSAARGSRDLWTASLASDDADWMTSFDFSLEPLVATTAEEQGGRFDPSGERIAYVHGKGTLMTVEADGTNPRTLFEHWSSMDFDWSPDGRWIAYSTYDSHYNAEIWIIPAEGGDAFNVSRHPDDDLEPRWSPDGKRLVWVSKRHRDTFDVWAAWLTREDAERTALGWREVFHSDEGSATEDEDADEEKAEADAEDESPDLPEVTIEFDGLWERVVRLTGELGDEDSPLVAADGSRVFFVAEPDGDADLYSVRYDGTDLKRLTEGGANPSAIRLGPKRKMLFYLDNQGAITRSKLDGTKGDPIPFSARVVVDRMARREATLEEAWRALNEHFYDPEFHGADWAAVLETYRPLAMAAPTDRDFSDVVNLMLGELNASHMGYYLPSDGGRRTPTGWIGAAFDANAGGPGLLVSEVLRNGPAAAVGVDLEVGERLMAVNGRDVEPTTNVHELFEDTVDRRTPLRILAADGTQRTVVVLPVNAGRIGTLRYETWVRQRRELTDRFSDGRLGYLHIESMDIPSFETFERDLQAAAEGRDGLIIDVRSNGGGWTTDYLMAVLMVQRHAYTVPRDDGSGIKAYPQSRLPLAAWTKPAATLCNEDSYSNAEIFSHAFKTLGRGPLVGTPTFGAVISTGGTQLPDGGWVRLPLRGWFVAGSDLNMELNGAVPDVLVASPPTDDLAADRDQQLQRAVDVLLAGIETDPRAAAW